MTDRKVAEFPISDDVRRIMGMPADPMGFNEKLNQIPDPAARSYAAQIQERKSAASLKGKAPPLGHAPPLDPEKMQQVARISMAQPTFEAINAAPKEATAPTVPPAIPGVGSAFEVNQNLSQGKTNGLVPVDMNNPGKQSPRSFSPETMQALKMAAESTTTPPAKPALDSNPEERPSIASETKAELDEVEEQLDDERSPTDYKAVIAARANFMSPERKKVIESRLTPLSMVDMIVKRELQQVIPIIPGQLEVTVRTISQRENIWILKYIYDFPGSVLYTQELINTCRLVCGVVALNGAYLPDHRINIGKREEEVSREEFEKKMGSIISYPVQLIADLSVQQIWFQERVDKLFTVKEIKNG